MAEPDAKKLKIGVGEEGGEGAATDSATDSAVNNTATAGALGKAQPADTEKKSEEGLTAIFKDWDKIKDDPEWHRRELAELLERTAAKEKQAEISAAAGTEAASAATEAGSAVVETPAPTATSTDVIKPVPTVLAVESASGAM